eukprot:761361-Hanusia_phi.AAC.10
MSERVAQTRSAGREVRAMDTIRRDYERGCSARGGMDRGRRVRSWRMSGGRAVARQVLRWKQGWEGGSCSPTGSGGGERIGGEEGK